MDGENKTMMWGGVIVVVVILIGAVFLLTRNNTPAQNTTTNTTTTTTNTNTTTNDSQVAVGESKTFPLTSQNNSGEDGTVTLQTVGNQVQVTITLSNPVATPEPAHIHLGSCPNPGTVIFGLSDVVNGASVTLLDTTLADLKAKGAIAVNVHKSSAESGVYYSCGNVAL